MNNSTSLEPSILRLAEVGDIPQIVELTKLVVAQMQAQGNFQWDDRYPVEATFIKDIADEVLWALVVESTGEVLGFCAITTDQGDDYAAVWDISQDAIVPHRLAVHPKAQGRGVAKSLLQKAEDLAVLRGFKSVSIFMIRISRLCIFFKR